MIESDTLDHITLDSDDILTIERFENNYYNHKNNLLSQNQHGGTIDIENLMKIFEKIINLIFEKIDLRKLLPDKEKEEAEKKAKAEKQAEEKKEFCIYNPQICKVPTEEDSIRFAKEREEREARVKEAYELKQLKQEATRNSTPITSQVPIQVSAQHLTQNPAAITSQVQIQVPATQTQTPTQVPETSTLTISETSITSSPAPSPSQLPTTKPTKKTWGEYFSRKNKTTSEIPKEKSTSSSWWPFKSSTNKKGGYNKKKLKKNIMRLYNCYILSQNQNGGAKNKLSFIIKKKLDKKIAELKFIEGGGFFEDANKLATDANKSITDVTKSAITDANKLATDANKSITDVTKSAITDANKFLTDTTNSVTSLLTPIDHVWLTNLHNFTKLKTTEATKLLRNATESVTSSFILTEEEKQKKVLIDLIFIEIEKPEIKEQINSLFSLEILKELINNEKENKNFDKFLEITNNIADIRVLIIGSFLKIFVQNLDKKAMEILLLKNQKGGKYNNIVSKYTNDLEGGNLGEFLIYTLPGYGRDITNILGSIIKTIFEGLLFMFQLLGKGVDISKLNETFKILGVIPYILTQVIFNKENFGRALQNNHW